MSAHDGVNRDVSEREPSHPDRTRRVLLTGGALGLAAVAGSTLGQAQPASAQAQTQNVVELLPSGDTSGKTDAANIADAFGALPYVLDPDTNIKYYVGCVLLGPGNWYVNSQIVKPPKADLIGSGPGTVVYAVAPFSDSATGVPAVIYSHNPAMNGTLQHETRSGTIANLVVDGTALTGQWYGIDIGDGWGHNLEHLWVQNFTGTGAIGLSVCNRNYWTEKFTTRAVHLINNTTGVQHHSAVSANSHEYQSVEYFIWAENNQNGLTFQGVLWNGHLVLNGNIGVPSASGPWMIGILPDASTGNTSNVYAQGCINYEVNVMGGTAGINPYSIYFGDNNTDASYSTLAFDGLIRSAGGGGGTGGGSCNATPGQLQIRGVVNESNNSLQAITTPAVPASAAAVGNNQNDCMVYFSVTGSGASISKVQVSGSTTGITGTSGQVFLPSQGPGPASGTYGTIAITYTGTLSWKWVSAI